MPTVLVVRSDGSAPAETVLLPLDLGSFLGHDYDYKMAPLAMDLGLGRIAATLRRKETGSPLGIVVWSVPEPVLSSVATDEVVSVKGTCKKVLDIKLSEHGVDYLCPNGAMMEGEWIELLGETDHSGRSGRFVGGRDIVLAEDSHVSVFSATKGGVFVRESLILSPTETSSTSRNWAWCEDRSGFVGHTTTVGCCCRSMSVGEFLRQHGGSSLRQRNVQSTFSLRQSRTYGRPRLIFSWVRAVMLHFGLT